MTNQEMKNQLTSPSQMATMLKKECRFTVNESWDDAVMGRMKGIKSDVMVDFDHDEDWNPIGYHVKYEKVDYLTYRKAMMAANAELEKTGNFTMEAFDELMAPYQFSARVSSVEELIATLKQL